MLRSINSGFLAIIFLILVHQNECEAARTWPVDQYRLQLPHQDSQILRLENRKNGPQEYHQDDPAIITPQLPQRNIYKSREDPAVFYKNHIFRNLTEREKSQLTWATPNNDLSNNLKFNLVNLEKFTDERRRYWRKPLNGDDKKQKLVQPSQICIKCPAEQTSVAQKGRERVRLTAPKLVTCDGEEAPPNVRFKINYGPKLGSLLTEGNHLAVASILYNNKSIQLCQFRYNVIVRRCPAVGSSPDMTSKCPHNGAWGTGCRFKCARSDTLISGGPPRITCGDTLRWSGPIPRCKEHNRTWCETKSIARMGRLTCETALGKIHMFPSTLPEGSTCSIQCRKKRNLDQETTPESKVVCQRGLWRGTINECPKPKRNKNKRRNWPKSGTSERH